MRQGRGFTLIEVVVAMVIIGVGVTALVTVISQSRRTMTSVQRWEQQESRATNLLMSLLHERERSPATLTMATNTPVKGRDEVLGEWEWVATPLNRIPDRALDLHRLEVRWLDGGTPREIHTVAVLRVQGR